MHLSVNDAKHAGETGAHTAVKNNSPERATSKKMGGTYHRCKKNCHFLFCLHHPFDPEAFKTRQR